MDENMKLYDLKTSSELHINSTTLTEKRISITHFKSYDRVLELPKKYHEFFLINLRLLIS